MSGIRHVLGAKAGDEELLPITWKSQLLSAFPDNLQVTLRSSQCIQPLRTAGIQQAVLKIIYCATMSSQRLALLLQQV